MKIEQHRLHTDDGAPIPFEESPNTGGALTPRYVVVHYTAGANADQSVAWLTNPRARASAHLVIGKDGAITQLVPFDRVAWHAGVSRWEGLEGLNRHSVGIELDNAGRLERKGEAWCAWFGGRYPAESVMVATHRHETEPCGWEVYPPAQIEAALAVTEALVERYDIRDVVGHEDISPGRKTDPGPAFPLGSFRARLLGRDRNQPPRFETTTALNIRTGPGTENEKLPGSPLPEGTLLEVLRSSGRWHMVNVVDAADGDPDLQGWVHGDYVRRSEP